MASIRDNHTTETPAMSAANLLEYCNAKAPWAMHCVLSSGHEGAHQDGGMAPVEWSTDDDPWNGLVS
jgi:hypothetical protein